jgi:heat shock protein HtpX
VPELRGVIAHEFGHFHGGDVAIGPWIYKTSAALVRTVDNLRGDDYEVLTLPFIWYGNLFFRVTHAVSRHQEVLADRLAAEVAGARALASGLRETHVAGLAFAPDWQGAVAPVLSAGFVPSLAAGFDAFMKTGWVAEQLVEASKAESQTGPNPYDTHPPLSDRLAALGEPRTRSPGPCRSWTTCPPSRSA